MNQGSIEKASKLIAGYEGLGGYNPADGRYYPYHCKADRAGLWTIGHGHLISEMDLLSRKFAGGLTLKEVDLLFACDLDSRIRRLSDLLYPYTADQFAGALSLYYNIEQPWTKGMTPYEQHHRKDFQAAARGMLKYVISNKKPQLGLWRRRMSEALCYLTGEVIIAKDAKTEAALEARLRSVLPGVVKPNV